ncbi:MAG: S-layer homology domain-containing protein [Deltaproteobacteria bacterium]|nr:S-layer homology domain-containing protein [Deltaproteobacteria bacterium]
MNRQMKYRSLFMFLVFVAVGALVISCAPKAAKPVGEMDTPEHHFYTGVKLLDQGKYAAAQMEFDRSIQLAPKFSKAYAGNGLVKAYQGDSKGAFEVMKQAWKYAKQDDETVFVHVCKIRLYTMGKPDKDWLNDALSELEAAIKIDPKSAAAYYFAGLAQKSALNFEKAGQMFKQVIDINKDYVAVADVEWNLTQKIQRAMPGTVAGKKIAIVERITRADAAALFMEELKIDVLYKKRTPKTFDTAFKDPEKAKTASSAAPATAADIAGHPLKVDIEGILAIGVRGLEAYPDGTFRPNEFVDRATYAMMIEDILIKVTGDNALATKFIGSVSPFPDLRADLPYFNAVMVVTSRGIMQAKDLTTGEFAPLNPVPGVDALLIIRKIKEELKFF